MIDLWSKAELLHDRREEEEEFSSGKTLSQALPFPCKVIISSREKVRRPHTDREWDEMFIPKNFPFVVEESFRLEFFSIIPVVSLLLSYRWPLTTKMCFYVLLTWQYDFDNGNLEDFSEERKDHCIFWKDHSAHRNVPELNIRHVNIRFCMYILGPMKINLSCTLKLHDSRLSVRCYSTSAPPSMLPECIVGWIFRKTS